MQKSVRLALLGVGSGFASLAANAAAVDVSSVVTDVNAQLVPIGLVAAAVLGIHFAIKAYHWIRRAGN